MSTQTKKSPDNTHKLNRRAICLRAPLALIILLTVFLAPQRSASTKALPQDPAERERPTKTVMINGYEAMENEAIVSFLDDTPEDLLQTLVANAISLSDASEGRSIGPAGLKMLHIRSKSMNTRALLNMLSRVAGVKRAEPNWVYRTQLTPNDTRFGEMWGLNNTVQVVGGQTGIAGADISAVQAWDVSTGSNSVVVGVMGRSDGYYRSGLTGRLWSAPRSLAVSVRGPPITCPAGSHRFNAVASSCIRRDENAHGTHTSRTIGA